MVLNFLRNAFSILQQTSFLHWGIAVFAISVTGFYLQGLKKKKVLKTLIEADIKYPLKLIQKEIISHDTR